MESLQQGTTKEHWQSFSGADIVDIFANSKRLLSLNFLLCVSGRGHANAENAHQLWSGTSAPPNEANQLQLIGAENMLFLPFPFPPSLLFIHHFIPVVFHIIQLCPFSTIPTSSRWK
jgi:hypothetical protein